MDVAPGDVCDLVIKYIYTDELDLPLDMLEDVLCLADYLQLEELLDVLSQYMKQHVSQANCFKYAALADTYNLTELCEFVYRFISSDMKFLVQREEILDQPITTIQCLLEEKTSGYISTSLLFEFLLRWVEKDRLSREVDFPRLFSMLKLESCSMTYVQNTIKTNDLVAKNSECLKYVEAFESKVADGLYKPGEIEKQVLIMLRKVDKNQLKIAVFGYVFYERRFAELPDMILPSSVRNACLTSRHPPLDGEGKTSPPNDIVLFHPSEYVGFLRYWDGACWRKEARELVEVAASCGECVIDMLMCKNRLFTLYNCVHGSLPYRIRIPPDAKKVLHIKYGHFSRHILHEMENDDFEVKMMVFKDVVYIMGHFKCKAKKVCKFWSFNATTCVLEDHSKGAKFGDFMYVDLEKEFILVQDFNSRSCLAFSVVDKDWHRIRRRLPKKPTGVHLNQKSSLTTSFDGQLYIFGAATAKNPSPGVVLKLDKEAEMWEEVTDMPYSICSSSVALARLPAPTLKCPAQCAHCDTNRPRNVSYDFEDSDDEGDDDDDEREIYLGDDSEDWWEEDSDVSQDAPPECVLS